MDDNEQVAAIMLGVLERLPSGPTLQTIGRLRQHGEDWNEIEDRLTRIAPDIAAGELPFSGEADQYVRRVMIAGRALETGGRLN